MSRQKQQKIRKVSSAESEIQKKKQKNFSEILLLFLSGSGAGICEKTENPQKSGSACSLLPYIHSERTEFRNRLEEAGLSGI